ncbi:MAG TPA: sensor histidine kinase [Acidimicrobiales bacterium]|nr:sensor histidine kinase [Acidimicrobiales bacterium]
MTAGRAEPRDPLYRSLLLDTDPLPQGLVDTDRLGDVGRRIRAAGVKRVAIAVDAEGDAVLIAENPAADLDDDRLLREAQLLTREVWAPAGRPGPLASNAGAAAEAADADLAVVAAWMNAVAGASPQPLVGRAGVEALAAASGADVAALVWPDGDDVAVCWGGASGGAQDGAAVSWPLPDDHAEVSAALDAVTGRAPLAPWHVVTARGGALAVAVSPPPASTRALSLLTEFLAFDLERGRTTREGRQRSLLEERMRIAGLIHDGVTQQVSNVVIQLQLLELAAQDPEKLAETLRSAREATAAALEELRSSLYELAPRSSHMEDLVPSLRSWIQDYAAQWGIDVTLEAHVTPDADGGASELDSVDIDPETGMLAYAVVQELLTNVRKHADANAAVVSLGCAPEELVVAVSDDGVGFPEEPAPSAGGRRMGLRILRDRVRAAGGRMEIESDLDEGARVTVHLPR